MAASGSNTHIQGHIFEMTTSGIVFKRKKVRHVSLVHGTFAGNDALGLFNLLEPAVLKWTGSTKITDQLREGGKKLLDNVVKDLGNFTPDYAAAFSKALGKLIDFQLFTWGSGNFHLARLKGAVELAEFLANTINQRHILPDERILLIGHSHAGQLFALITLFLENGEKARQLYGIVEQHEGMNQPDLSQNIAALANVQLDIVTLGTPVRYPWGRYEKYRLLPIVNHRSPVKISGLLSTRDGDYVQQWGIEGSDLAPPDNLELNDTLDAILDKGRDRDALNEQVKIETRRPPQYADGSKVADPLLIDYKDKAYFPNFLSAIAGISHCIKTLFGHGVYTKQEKLSFNIDIIKNRFYQATE